MKKIVYLTGLCTILLIASCGQKEEKKEENIKFIVSNPLKKDTTVTRNYVCQLSAIHHIELRSLEKGYLQNIYVDEGQFIKKGQKMFQIMPIIYNAEVQKAEAEANYAQIEYDNTKQLADKNVVSKNELAMMKAKLEKAKAELQLAKAHQQFAEIKAPFDGIMDHFQVRLGSYLDEGELLTTLSDNSEMWAYFNVPEAEYLNFKTHEIEENLNKVNLLMANNEIFQYPGVVKTVEADFNNETGNIAFRATFPNPNKLLRHGETGNIVMTIPVKKAIMIPQKATFEVLEKKYVFVVDKNNIVHAKEIEIDAEMPDIYIIKKGLKGNEKIMIEGIRKVKDGDKVSYTFKDTKSIYSSLSVYVE